MPTFAAIGYTNDISLNVTNPFRNQPIVIYAQWDNTPAYAALEFRNGTGTVVNTTFIACPASDEFADFTHAINVTCDATGNWTNFTIWDFTAVAWQNVGNHSVKIWVNDSSEAWNGTSTTNFTLWSLVNLSCPDISGPPFIISTTGQSFATYCLVMDTLYSGNPTVNGFNVTLYNDTALAASNTTNSTGWTGITFSTPTETSYTLVANISNNTNTYYNRTTPFTHNKTIFVSSTTNPRPVIQSSYDVTLSYVAWEQYRPNYSFPLPFVVPNFTGGTFNGMSVPWNIYAPLTYMSDMFFKHPTRVEMFAYNFTINATNATPNLNDARLINVTIPIPWNQTKCDPPENICNPFGQFPLYKNQSILPAKFETIQEPGFMNDMNQSYVSQNITVLMKNPESFVVNVTNSTGYTYVINGSQQLGPAPNATFTEGKIVLNLTNISSEGPYKIFVLLGLQDMTCFEQVEQAPGGFSNHTNFMLYCEQHSDPDDPFSPPAGPPKFESSPTLITFQDITGFNPFEIGEGAEPLNTTGSMIFRANITNPLLNYTGDNLYAEFRYPLNVTEWNGTHYTANPGNVSFNISEDHTVGWWNRTAGAWITINSTTDPHINTTEGCMNMTDDIPGSPMYGKNMTMCYEAILFNLNQTLSYDTGGLANGWVYAANVSLNVSVSMGFKILNHSTSTTGTTMGEAGSTNQFKATIAGGQSTGGGTGGTSSAQSNAGMFKLDNTILPGIDNVVCTNPPNCGNITVFVNNQPYYNWTTGSPDIVINSQSSGVQSISISYSVPSATVTPLTLPASSYTAPEEVKETHGLGEIKAGESGTITFEEPELAITETIISVINTVNDITLKLIKLTEKPATIGVDVSGKIYVYLNMQTLNINDEDISSVKIKFKVTKSWVTTNNVNVSTIALNRWANDQWNALPTSKVTEDTDYYHFEATSTGLSYFAVNGEEAAPACVENWDCPDWATMPCVNGTQTRTCTDLNDCGTTVNKPAESQDCEVGIAGVVGWPIEIIAPVVAIIAVIVVIVVVVYTQKEKIFGKKKPSKKKKLEYYYSKSEE